MNGLSSLWSLLLRQLPPTPVQGLVSLAAAAAILVIGQFGAISNYLGITSEGVASFGDNLHAQTSGLLASSFTSTLVLVTFWGMVGLIAYLLTWGAVNIYIEPPIRRPRPTKSTSPSTRRVTTISPG